MDSNDHQSHTAYSTGRNKNKTCPDTHPIMMQRIRIDAVYTLKNYISYPDELRRLTWANGETTGMGFHADFVNGTYTLTKSQHTSQQSGWNQTRLEEYADRCVNNAYWSASRYCNKIHFSGTDDISMYQESPLKCAKDFLITDNFFPQEVCTGSNITELCGYTGPTVTGSDNQYPGNEITDAQGNITGYSGQVITLTGVRFNIYSNVLY